MRSTGPLVSIRRTLIAKGFAALLLALTISPFTAPFATIDAAELMTETGHSTLDSAATPAKDLATADLLPAPLFVPILQPVTHEVRAIGPIHLQRLRPIVLRV